jgi:hypothetical protein
MGHPAARGNLAAAAILNQNPFFEMASSNFTAHQRRGTTHFPLASLTASPR